MRTVSIYRDAKRHVVAFYFRGEFFYTKTYIYDSDGYVEKSVTVYADGTIQEN